MNKSLLLSAILFGSITGFMIGKKTVCKQRSIKSTISQFRKADHPVDPLFVNRWSPRAMSGETVTQDELNSLFEAMRWAPSSYNEQPWRILYAVNGSPEWNLFFDLLVPFNQEWAKNAGALLLVISKDNFTHNNTYSVSHSFDTGAALQNLALQGELMDLVVHGMAGFDYQKAKDVLEIPNGYTIEAMFAVGKPGDLTRLPEAMQANEKPSDRKKIEQLTRQGKFSSVIS